MSSTSQQPTKHRGPPPSLFLHPSPGASHVSLPGILGAGIAGASHTNTTFQKNETIVDNDLSNEGKQSSDDHPARSLQKAESSRKTDRTDALWAEMQATLEDVELSASGGTHVFGPEHGRKLAELRGAQIALAQAWARSEADEAIETHFQDNATSAGGDEFRMRATRFADATKSAQETDAGPNNIPPPGSAAAKKHVEQLGKKIEGDAEVDIAMARKRREANDQYFKQVNKGVLDVVAKLEEVAQAMRAIEQESQDM